MILAPFVWFRLISNIIIILYVFIICIFGRKRRKAKRTRGDTQGVSTSIVGRKRSKHERCVPMSRTIIKQGNNESQQRRPRHVFCSRPGRRANHNKQPAKKVGTYAPSSSSLFPAKSSSSSFLLTGDDRDSDRFLVDNNRDRVWACVPTARIVVVGRPSPRRNTATEPLVLDDDVLAT
jgi:hypothetical protein